MNAPAPKLQYSLLCLGFDETKGPPTLQHVLHELPLAPLPYEFPPNSGLFLVNGWLFLPDKSQCRVRIVGPSEEAVVDQTFELRAEPDGLFQMSLAFLEGIRFPEAGDYWVSVFLDGRLQSQYPLVVVDAEA